MNAELSTKEQILKVAGKHFSLHGYDAASLDAVAKECEITKPAIYYHFKDKAALYEAVLLLYFTQLLQQIEINTQKDDPIENLESYIRTFGGYLSTVPSFAAIFSREIANDAKSVPDSCILALSQTLKRLLEILHSGREKGVFACENLFMIQMMVVTTLTAYVTTKGLRQKVFSFLDQYSEHLDPDLEDIVENLSRKIIKALTC